MSVALPIELYHEMNSGGSWEYNIRFPTEDDRTLRASSGRLTVEMGYFAEWTAYIAALCNYFESNTIDDEKKFFVRSKAFVSNDDITLEVNDAYGTWFFGTNDYWYYNDVMIEGESTNELNYKIILPSYMENGGDEFKLIVICEMIEAQQDAGGAYFANWD